MPASPKAIYSRVYDDRQTPANIDRPPALHAARVAGRAVDGAAVAKRVGRRHRRRIGDRGHRPAPARGSRGRHPAGGDRSPPPTSAPSGSARSTNCSAELAPREEPRAAAADRRWCCSTAGGSPAWPRSATSLPRRSSGSNPARGGGAQIRLYGRAEGGQHRAAPALPGQYGRAGPGGADRRGRPERQCHGQARRAYAAITGSISACAIRKMRACRKASAIWFRRRKAAAPISRPTGRCCRPRVSCRPMPCSADRRSRNVQVLVNANLTRNESVSDQGLSGDGNDPRSQTIRGSTGQLARDPQRQCRALAPDADRHVRSHRQPNANRSQVRSLATRQHRRSGTIAIQSGRYRDGRERPAVPAPAGAVTTSVKVSGEADSFEDARSTRSADPTHLSRNIGSGQFSIDLPIASRRESVLPALGELSANFNIAADRISQFGTLRTIGYGVNWKPVDRLSLIFSVTDDEGAPTVQQLEIRGSSRPASRSMILRWAPMPT